MWSLLIKQNNKHLCMILHKTLQVKLSHRLENSQSRISVDLDLVLRRKRLLIAKIILPNIKKRKFRQKLKINIHNLKQQKRRKKQKRILKAILNQEEIQNIRHLKNSTFITENQSKQFKDLEETQSEKLKKFIPRPVKLPIRNQLTFSLTI